jgi:4-(2-carboxyphenyl)-2-oxobut-3-enoate aldolase
MTPKFSPAEGIYCLMPTPTIETADDWRSADNVNLAEAARVASTLAASGVAAIMGNGTLGERSALLPEEQLAFAKAVVEGAAGRCPVLLGATSLGTRETIRRGEQLAAVGVSGFLLGRPMWWPLDDDAIIDFYASVAEALPESAIIVYDNPTAFQGKLGSTVYQALAAIPQIVGVKYPAFNSQRSEDLAAMDGKMSLLTLDVEWEEAWKAAPTAAPGCWTYMASAGPSPVLALQAAISAGDHELARRITDDIWTVREIVRPRSLTHTYHIYEVPVMKQMYESSGFMKAGPAMPPFHRAPDAELDAGRRAGVAWAQLAAKYQESAPVH